MSKPSLIDIGANLTNSAFAKDLEEILEQAQESGIQHIIVTGTDEASSHEAAELTNTNSDLLYSTAGIHPHTAKDWDKNSSLWIRGLAKEDCVKAIGETGLDFNRDFSPRPQQESAFEQQIEIAAELQLPLFMHERDAHQRFYEIIKAHRDHIKAGVVHCFTGDKKALYNYLDLDLHIGVTGWICDERRGLDLQEQVKNIPLSRLMLETDSPYLIPRTIRPRPKKNRNIPANLTYVVEQVATCLDKTPQEIATKTTETAKTFFNI